MQPDVFISYASPDKGVADAVRQALNGGGIGCWMAPDSLVPGQSYAAGIVYGISAAKVLVLIWSARTQAASWVMDELERAKSKGIPIIPFRIDDVLPSNDLELFISRPQRLDAIELPIERHFEKLVHAVRFHIGRADAEAAVENSLGLGPYFVKRLEPHRHSLDQPVTPGKRNTGVIRVERLRERLAEDKEELLETEEVRVQGTLFPCALLSSGWWEKRKAQKGTRIDWQNGLQSWLFHGFDLWGPSWDITGDFAAWSQNADKRYFIAQLGEGDEANSIPVLIPPSKARRLQEELSRKNWGGMEAEVSAQLGHRKHFSEYIDSDALEVFGGLLDFCLCVRDDREDHYIHRLAHKTDLYSGYLWKCVAPTNILGSAPCISDVYFIWEHANFSDPEALAYALEAMNFKEEQVRRKTGSDLTLVHKSSSLVPGTPAYSADTIYRMLVGKSGEKV